MASVSVQQFINANPVLVIIALFVVGIILVLAARILLAECELPDADRLRGGDHCDYLLAAAFSVIPFLAAVAIWQNKTRRVSDSPRYMYLNRWLARAGWITARP